MKAAFENVRDEMRREADKGADAAARGQTVIPELSFADVRADKISDATRGQIRARGCVVIRGVFERSRAEDWNGEIGDCLERNNSVERPQEKAGFDIYFGDLESGKPQIYGIYWSRPQVEVRQARSMAETRRFLNRLWDVCGRPGMSSTRILIMPRPTAPAGASRAIPSGGTPTRFMRLPMSTRDRIMPT